VRSDPRHQSGSVVVEFALLLPILFVVGLALVQVAVLAHDRLIVAQAARAGARAAAVDPSDPAVEGEALDAAVGLDPLRVDVDIERPGSLGGPVVVRVSYAANTASVLAGWLLPAVVVIEDAATMRQEFA
jgi:hypothetical protein